MDTYEAEGFFPEREVLRARRRRARVDEPVDPSEARTPRANTWVVWVAIYLPMFSTIVFGRNGHITPKALEVIKYSCFLLLVASVACIAVILWRAFLRANSPSS